jgi:hypothetical protein
MSLLLDLKEKEREPLVCGGVVASRRNGSTEVGNPHSLVLASRLRRWLQRTE